MVLTVAMIVLAVTLTWLLVRASGRMTGSAVPVAAANNARPLRTPPPPLPSEPISIGSAPALGDARAPVALIVYSDVDCPFCGTFARETLPELRKRYVETGRVLFVFRHLPLGRLHPLARQAAEAMECAGAQGRLFDLHDRLFAKPKQSDALSIAGHVRALGLDTTRFAGCMTASEGAGRVSEDVESAQVLGVTGTPTFFVGINLPERRVQLRQRLSGALPIDRWPAVLDKWLAEAEATK
jgi:protein-disulfide isomerase